MVNPVIKITQINPVFACGVKFVPCRILETISAGSGGHSKTFTVSTLASVLYSCLNYIFAQFWLSFRSITNPNWSLQLNFSQIQPILSTQPGFKSLNFNQLDYFNRSHFNYPSNSISVNRVILGAEAEKFVPLPRHNLKSQAGTGGLRKSDRYALLIFPVYTVKITIFPVCLQLVRSKF